MIYEDNYMEWLNDTYDELSVKKPLNGSQVQDICLNNTDDSQLTERERLIIILPVIKWEIEHDMLTDELRDELYLYNEDIISGKFDGILGEDEEEQVKHDLFECYEKVFGNK